MCSSFSLLRQLVATGLLLFAGYSYSIAQNVINLEPELPATIANTQQGPGKTWYDKTSSTWCTVTNNNQAVTVQLVITDCWQQKKIIDNGLEIWIDAKGKKKKSTGIAFPMAPTPPSANNKQPANNNQSPANNHPVAFEPEAQHSNDQQAMRKQLQNKVSQQREMQLTGFIDELNGIQNCNHASGLQVSLQFVHDTLIYQATIPFQTFAKPPGFNVPISIGIIEKGIQLQGPGSNGMPDFDGPSDGAGGMMPPPGPPPGMDEQGEEEDGARQFWQDDEVWYKFVVKS